MKRFLLLILITTPIISDAAIYKQVMPDGTVVFSDQPSPGAEEIEVETPTTIPPPKMPAQQPQQENDQQEQAEHYTNIAFITPTNDMTIRDNRGRLGVALNVEPSFRVQDGHTISLKLDGEQIGNPSKSLQFDLENIDRGTHTLQATIMDKNGETLIDSDAIKFHMKRFSKLFKQNN